MVEFKTISQLIAALQAEQAKCGADKLVAIDDADTGWPLEIIDISEDKGVILMRGSYTREIANEA